MKIFKRLSAFTAAAVTAVSASAAAMPAFAKATPNVVDYEETENNWAKLLQYTLYFYDANMCGTGVAMGNAQQAVKDAADITIGSNDEDGIADYLESLF